MEGRKKFLEGHCDWSRLANWGGGGKGGGKGARLKTQNFNTARSHFRLAKGKKSRNSGKKDEDQGRGKLPGRTLNNFTGKTREVERDLDFFTLEKAGGEH